MRVRVGVRVRLRVRVRVRVRVRNSDLGGVCEGAAFAGELGLRVVLSAPSGPGGPEVGRLPSRRGLARLRVRVRARAFRLRVRVRARVRVRRRPWPSAARACVRGSQRPSRAERPPPPQPPG